VFTKSTNNQSLEMTAPAPCKPLLVCGTGMYFGSFAHPLYRELKHLFNRIDSRANSTHTARAKGLQTEGSDTLPLSALDKQTPHKMDVMQCNLLPAPLSFVVKKALSLQGQTTFQRLACWVLQHNPLPEVPFQVDDDGKYKQVGARTSLKAL
jgi:hypothetical protein